MENKEVTEQEHKLLLCSRIQQLRSSNAALLAENDLFENFGVRLDLHVQLFQAGGEGPEAAGASQLEGGGRRRRSRCYTSDRLLQEQKLYVAQTEITETQQGHEDLKQRHERIQDNYKASLEESELCLAEIRKAKKDFERRTLKPMKDNSLEIKKPERVLQYLQDNSKDTQLEKLHLKSQALKVEEKKLQKQLQLKKETGKDEYEEGIIQENSDQRSYVNLEELKVKSLIVHRVLSSHKEKLQSATIELTELSNDISNKEQMLVKLEEIQQTEEECLKAEALNQHLCCQMTDYEAPDITEYTQLKYKHKTLRYRIHSLERKVGIAEMASKTHSEAGSKQRATLTSANSAAAGARPGEDHVPVKLPHIAERNTERPTEFIRE
ncbi:cilia- and flagella-associated protein 263 [Paralichthys olivaceus]|uniref:cilia- and flagella-associated protein 263 n=1 Tax=Paralichthys olivaceus TaxID=8255 RepID=UPI00097DD49E|nr:PREDICTED: coiled-coil domain-containing protein 113-like [Paralichthys olivaceus]